MTDPGHGATSPPEPDAQRTPKSWLRPNIVLPVFLVLVILVVLIAPNQDNEDPRNYRLTTFSADPRGARGLYDVLTQLGWKTSQRRVPLQRDLDTGAVYMILRPPIPFTNEEDSALIRMVRAGGRLLVVSVDSAWSSQFRMWASFDTTATGPSSGMSVAGDSAGIVHRTVERSPLWDDYAYRDSPIVHVLPPVNDTVAIFMWRSTAHDDSATAGALMLGRRVGRGRVVLVSDPWLLANDVVREGKAALAVQRALEWLDPPARRVVFDEYHQGYGPEQQDAIVAALTDTPLGRVTLQVVLASLVLLVAIAIRPILPIPTIVFRRRSPLEHVDALARAYAQIHATKLGTQRLVRGLRRRRPIGIGRSNSSDASYLDAVRARYTIDSDDVTALTNALTIPVSDDEFMRAGQAIGRIEHSISTQ